MNQRYVFVFAAGTKSPEKTFAHELGHAAFGFLHRDDTDNVMRQGIGTNMWRLRKDQWDRINS